MNQERPGTILKPRAMDVNVNSLGCTPRFQIRTLRRFLTGFRRLNFRQAARLIAGLRVPANRVGLDALVQTAERGSACNHCRTF